MLKSLFNILLNAIKIIYKNVEKIVLKYKNSNWEENQ